MFSFCFFVIKIINTVAQEVMFELADPDHLAVVSHLVFHPQLEFCETKASSDIEEINKERMKMFDCELISN